MVEFCADNVFGKFHCAIKEAVIIINTKFTH